MSDKRGLVKTSVEKSLKALLKDLLKEVNGCAEKSAVRLYPNVKGEEKYE